MLQPPCCVQPSTLSDIFMELSLIAWPHPGARCYIVHRTYTCAARMIVNVVSCLPETSVGPQTDSCLRDGAGFPSSPVSSLPSSRCSAAEARHTCARRRSSAHLCTAEGGREPPERGIWAEWGVNYGAALKTEEARDVAVMQAGGGFIPGAGSLGDVRRLERRVRAENVRNVHVGWFVRHAGTACGVLPREIWRCVPCKRYRGERREGAKDRERERDECARLWFLCACVRGRCCWTGQTKGSQGHFSVKRPCGETHSLMKYTLLSLMVNKPILCAIPLRV